MVYSHQAMCKNEHFTQVLNLGYAGTNLELIVVKYIVCDKM